MEYMGVMRGSIFCEAKQTQDHDRSCEGSPGEWSDELEANSFDSGIDQLPDRKILFPALWQYSRLSKTIPRERVGKANCVNDSDDTDAHIFDCTTNCYLCHSQNGEAIYKIEEFNNDDGEEDEELVEFVELPVFDGNYDDDDDTFGSTNHSVAPPVNPCANHGENWEQCIHCARERLRAEGWEFPHHEGDGKDDGERGTSGDNDKDEDERSKAVDDGNAGRKECNTFSRVFIPPAEGERAYAKLSPDSTIMLELFPPVFFPPAKDSGIEFDGSFLRGQSPHHSHGQTQEIFPRAIAPLPKHLKGSTTETCHSAVAEHTVGPLPKLIEPRGMQFRLIASAGGW
ncbi:uncharacterized protein C8R40DRAFT_1166176 [Lentinula edodes]|uniref:uncharacterized protein n=1 Tax=Lentinula edodes TaxID=5353 RepID=UPI001E8CF5A0|nr:uncharacterized protein C8R40DRAFT_1166176 [Lentinula edodes]KAH7879962.1 hypothetical protein C8R40DRAFT_1166176 [Lentinula edodes]